MMDIDEEEFVLEINPKNVEKITEALQDVLTPLIDAGVSLNDVFMVLITMAPALAKELDIQREEYINWAVATYDDHEFLDEKEEDKEIDPKDLN